MKIGVSLPVREMQNDLVAIKDFAQTAEALGLTHLRVPEQILRPNNGHLHESMMTLSYIAALTNKIELVPSVIILPTRQTALFAKQAAQLDILSQGRVRLGIDVGGNAQEYAFLGQDFNRRGDRCSEQMRLLKQLWSQQQVDFHGEFDQIQGAGLNPLPVQRPIPMWIGAAGNPKVSVLKRIAELSDGWFVLADPEQFPHIRDHVFTLAEKVGRSSEQFGQEAGVAVVGPREHEWQSRVVGWHKLGLSHLCLRTLGGELSPAQHIAKLQEVVNQLPDAVC